MPITSKIKNAFTYAPPLSAALAVLSNLWPLAGVIFFEWNIASVILLYWVENIIIGVWNIVKISGARAVHFTPKNLFLIVFFTIHYGGFCAGHGTFIFGFLKDTTLDTQFFTQLGFIGGVAHLFIFHGISTIRNYFLSGVYKTTHPSKQLFAPYAHIVVIHIAIIATGFIAMTLNQAMPLLVFMIIGKTLIEILFISKDHLAHSNNN